MKNLILLLAAVAVATGVFAQDRNPFLPTQNCVMMRDKHMWVVKGMEDIVTINGGVKVKPNGTIKLKNGKTVTLDEGYAISYYNGRMSGTNVKEDKILMKSSNKIWLLTRIDNSTFLNNTTVLPEGVITTKEGKTITMKNGDWIDENGNVNIASK